MQPNIINQYGFSWFSLPREDILPLTLLEKRNESLLQRISTFLFGMKESANAFNADIFTLFPKPERGHVPKVTKPRPVADFKGFDIINIKSNLDLQGLKSVPLLSGPKISSELKSASKLLYTFKDVSQISVDNEVALEDHLNITPPMNATSAYMEKLKEGCIYIITDVLQTTEFTIQDVTGLTFDNAIDIKSIQDYATIQTNLKSTSENKMQISHKGASALTFAIKASKIIFKERTNNFSLKKTELRFVRNGDADSNTSNIDYPLIKLD